MGLGEQFSDIDKKLQGFFQTTEKIRVYRLILSPVLGSSVARVDRSRGLEEVTEAYLRTCINNNGIINVRNKKNKQASVNKQVKKTSEKILLLTLSDQTSSELVLRQSHFFDC